jgi:endonuclease/exonuclease/phosphatase family metal-dependent hydrolase
MRRLVLAASSAVLVLCATIAPPAQAASSSLTFATFNISKVSAPAPAPGWDIRRERLTRVIAQSGADVVGLQEASWEPTPYAKTQALDVANLLRGVGYVTPALTKASQQCAWTKEDPHKCIHTAALFFRTSTVQQASTPQGDSAGVLNEGMVAAGLDADSAKREVAWAYLRPVAGGATFLAISAHATNFQDAAHEAGRVAFAAALGGWADAWNAQHGLPGATVVLMADLNSYDMRQPAGAQQVLRGSGWTDAAAAPARKNDRFSTINVNPVTGATGWPQVPYLFKRPATRIDYIFTRGAAAPTSYEVVLYLNADGTFNCEYQASDHQMVRVVLAFPAA